MLTETAKVIGVDGNSVFLEVQKSHHCQSCSAKSTCGHSLLANIHPNRKSGLVVARNGLSAMEGEQLEIGLPKQQVVLLALITYGLPLITMMIMILITSLFKLSEIWILLSAFGGLFLAFLGLGKMQKLYNFVPSPKIILS